TGEERRDARTARAQALGQRALRVELELEFAAEVLALELLVLAHVGRNHFPDLAGFQQLAEAETVDAGIVGDRSQALHPGIPQGRDQRLGDAAEAEATHRQRLAVGDQATQGGRGIGEQFAVRSVSGVRGGWALRHGEPSGLEPALILPAAPSTAIGLTNDAPSAVAPAPSDR